MQKGDGEQSPSLFCVSAARIWFAPDVTKDPFRDLVLDLSHGTTDIRPEAAPCFGPAAQGYSHL